MDPQALTSDSAFERFVEIWNDRNLITNDAQVGNIPSILDDSLGLLAKEFKLGI